jgi:hypothetical protein
MIKCKICNQEFSNLITWKHLKRHNITSKEYKSKYGELVSEEYKKAKSEKSSGANNPNYGNKLSEESKKIISLKNSKKVPHNKNKSMSEQQKQVLSEKAKLRNKIWKETNSHPIVGIKRTQETISKIKKERSKQRITDDQVKKAIDTKIKKGYDLAFFRGRTHSCESKEKISKSSKQTMLLKNKKSIEESSARLLENGYTLMSVDHSFMHIKCNTCDSTFTRSRQYATTSKITPTMCHHCFPAQQGISIQETELINFVKSIEKTIEVKNRNIINPKEIDIFIPRCNLAIEYNGLYWHSEIYKDKNYHLNKTKDALKKNVTLIHIFEDEWINSKKIVESKIKSLLGKIEIRFYARKCIVKELDSSTANDFLKNNHIQGPGRSNVRLGLFHNDKLLSVMTFLKGDISKKIKGWELNRFCSLIDTQVVGAAGKLFKYFINNYNPDTILSFSDNRWSKDKNHSVYKKIGFEYQHCSPPNYWYIQSNCTKRFSRYSLKKPFNSSISEKELRESQGYLRVYDCGSSKWIWNRNKDA